MPKLKSCYVLYGVPDEDLLDVYEVSWINLGNPWLNLGNPEAHSFQEIQKYLESLLGDRILVSYVWANSRDEAKVQFEKG